MAKDQETRWTDRVQQMCDDEVRRRVAQVTHKLKQQLAGAAKEQKDSAKAADHLRRELSDEKVKLKTAEAKVTQLDNELARLKVTVRSLQDQAVKDVPF